jgi:5,6,7,8-tetrahydromethanopterin hydro-lyase
VITRFNPKEAIARAVNGEPTPAYVVEQRNVAKHPFAPGSAY